MTKTQMKLQQLLAGVHEGPSRDVQFERQRAGVEAVRHRHEAPGLDSALRAEGRGEGGGRFRRRSAEADRAGGHAVQGVLRSWALKQFLGEGSQLLADFGLEKAQRKVPTSETKTLAHAKSLATRLARKTLGSEQKTDVLGIPVASVTIAPNTGGVGGVG